MFRPEYEQRLLQCSDLATGSLGRQQAELRLIPRRLDNNWARNFALKSEEGQNHMQDQYEESQSSALHSSSYACLLRNEMLGATVKSVDAACQMRASDKMRCETGDFKERENTRLFHYAEKKVQQRQPFSNISVASQRLLSAPLRPRRRLPRLPYKILDAPDLQDDFYLNLIDWSAGNTLGVGLGCSVYLWSASNSQVTRLCDLSHEDNPVTAVAWHEGSRHLAVGTLNGYVSIWDAGRQKQLARLEGHMTRVSSLAWRAENMATGSRDNCILERDTRAPPHDIVRCLRGHRQEVCGLDWSSNGQYLASGSNDCRVMVWTSHANEPLHTFVEHKAPVKALAWSPHKHGLLASGGGSADRCLRFWNALNGQMVQCVDTGAQISNLAWARQSSELVTTHGHGQPQIIVWRYPTLKQVVRLTGHTHRVVYLAVSPDGESVVTGAGDETLRFWTVFTKVKSPKVPASVLALNCDMR